jgi:aspartyl-tRNA(Asn)/glutamyl-tRNA(Gln) amidotransferase subunit C
VILKKEVQHIAKLARLGLAEKEIGKFQKELSSILGYIEKLKEVDVSKAEPTSHSVLLENILRNDRAESEKVEVREKIIEQMPETKDGYLKVKSVF